MYCILHIPSGEFLRYFNIDKAWDTTPDNKPYTAELLTFTSEEKAEKHISKVISFRKHSIERKGTEDIHQFHDRVEFDIINTDTYGIDALE